MQVAPTLDSRAGDFTEASLNDADSKTGDEGAQAITDENSGVLEKCHAGHGRFTELACGGGQGGGASKWCGGEGLACWLTRWKVSSSPLRTADAKYLYLKAAYL